MNVTALPQITDVQKKQFHEEGYFVLENVLGGDDLQLLREECQVAIEGIEEEMDRLDDDVSGINIRGNRYFITQPSLTRPSLRQVLVGEVMAEICRATLGGNAGVAWEQFVVKGSERGMKFSWHQDSAYALNGGATDIPPALSCWCALDDMSEANGTVYLLPYSRAGNGELQPHTRDEESNDLVGYFGEDPGIPVIVPAGSIAVFSGLAFHRSGFNTTDKMRRVYLAQYCAGVPRHADGRPFGRAEPFLEDGKIVTGPKQ